MVAGSCLAPNGFGLLRLRARRLPVGDDSHLNVARRPGHLHGKQLLGAKEPAPRLSGFGEEDLRHRIRLRKADKGLSRILGVKDPGIDVQFTGEIEMAFECIPLLARQGCEPGVRDDGNGEAIRAQVVGDAAAPADQPDGRG